MHKNVLIIIVLFSHELYRRLTNTLLNRNSDALPGIRILASESSPSDRFLRPSWVVGLRSSAGMSFQAFRAE